MSDLRLPLSVPAKLGACCAVIGAGLLVVFILSKQSPPPPASLLTTNPAPIANALRPVTLAELRILGNELKSAHKLPTDAARIAAIRDVLRRLMERVWSMSPTELDALVRAYLATGEDATTGLAFDVGTDGSIDDPSSLRVALLDLLARLAPSEAIALGRELLPTAKSQDEWAAALRAATLMHAPHGASASADQAFLVEQVRRRLHQRDWLDQPSGGFLAAFDAVPFLDDAALYGDLAGLCSVADTSLLIRDAAALALRESAQAYPFRFTSFVLGHPEYLATEPALRGQLLASADVRDDAMRSGLLDYIRSSALPATEVDAFLAGFPQTTWTSGLRLLTSAFQPAIPADKRAEQYAGALQLLDALLVSPMARDSVRQKQLKQIRETTQLRLVQTQAGKGQ